MSPVPARSTPNGFAPSEPSSQKDASVVQKRQSTRTQNRRTQELEEQQIANEELGTRSSKAKAYNVVKEYIQSQRRTTRGRAPQKRSKDIVQSDEESDIARPPSKKRYISESQPAMISQCPAPDPEHGYHSDIESRRGNSRRQARGSIQSKQVAKFNPNILKKVIQDTSQDAADEGVSVAEEEEEHRDVNNVNEGSDADGEVTNSNDMEDLEALMSQPAALQDALSKETPRVADHGEDEEVPSEPQLSSNALRSQRKTLPRHRLEEEDAGEISEEDQAGAKHSYNAYHGAVNIQTNTSINGPEGMPGVRSETSAPATADTDNHFTNVSGRVRNTRVNGDGNIHGTPSNTQVGGIGSRTTPQLGRRAQAIIAERPNPQATTELHIRSAANSLQATKLSSDMDADCMDGKSESPAQQWPIGTHLVYSKRGKVCITKQNPYIQMLAYAAIEAFLADLVFREEEVPATRKFMHEAGILERCTRRLQEDNNEALFKFTSGKSQKHLAPLNGIYQPISALKSLKFDTWANKT
ncbi:hypothetical protein K474DRAFT_1709980 [Panus rudis PR-1116 ss-1]|nr:hypothetical protein K474DRAFT_1709980 [Panus rudis PR-1116 ss-1]